MRYFSEETVMDVLDKIERENGHSVALSFPNFSELQSINIHDKHGRLIDERVAYDKIAEQEGGLYVDMDLVDLGLQETPTIVEASNE